MVRTSVGENVRDEPSIILYKTSSHCVHAELAPDFCRMCSVGGTLDLDTIYCLSNQVKFVVEAETLCSRTFFFYDFFTSTVPCDQIFALRPPIIL